MNHYRSFFNLMLNALKFVAWLFVHNLMVLPSFFFRFYISIEGL